MVCLIVIAAAEGCYRNVFVPPSIAAIFVAAAIAVVATSLAFTTSGTATVVAATATTACCPDSSNRQRFALWRFESQKKKGVQYYLGKLKSLLILFKALHTLLVQ